MPYDIWGNRTSRRKSFSASTKEQALTKARGRCMNCHRLLHPRAKEFDHKNNNSSDNSLRNCFVVCSNCHRANTVIKKIKQKDGFGNVVGYKTIKRKVGYKKDKRRTRRVPIRNLFGFIVGYKTVRVKNSRRRKSTHRKARHQPRSIFDINLGF